MLTCELADETRAGGADGGPGRGATGGVIDRRWLGGAGRSAGRGAGGGRWLGGAGAPSAVRFARRIALAVGFFLLPWSLLLGVLLPASARVPHWSLAWMGLDAAEAVAALVTAVLLARADVRAAIASAACSALLLVDAWFDVCTSAPGLDRGLAIGEAVCAELPLAAAGIWLALRLLRSVRPH